MDKDRDIIEILVDEPFDGSEKPSVSPEIIPSENNAAISASEKKAKKKEKRSDAEVKPSKKIFESARSLPPRLVKITCAVCAALIIATPIIGYTLPKPEKKVDSALASLRESDSGYLEAKENKLNAEKETAELNSSLNSSQTELDKFNISQDTIDKMAEENAKLEEEKKTLEGELERKQKELNELEATASMNKSKTTTLPPGEYTAGKNISPGKYTITGSGNIVISNSGKSIVNEMLSSEGKSYTLNDGDIIRVENSVKITPQ